MAVTSALFASGTPVTTSTSGTWATATAATGANNAAFAVWTSTGSGANGTIRCEGFGAQTAIGATPLSVDSVSVTVYGYVNNVSRIPTIAVQLTAAGTLIGSPQTMTATTTTTNSQTFTFTGVTWAQLANLGVRVSFTRAAVTQSATGNVDAVSVAVTYTSASQDFTGSVSLSGSGSLSVGTPLPGVARSVSLSGSGQLGASGAAGSGPSSTILGQWAFEGDNLTDSSGNGRNGTAVGYTPSYTTGPFASTRAVVLNSDLGRIEWGRTGLEPVTADDGLCTMAWVKITDPSTNYVDLLGHMRAYDSTKSNIAVIGDELFYMTRWGSRLDFATTTSLSLADGQWHSVILIDNEDRFAIIVDEAVIASSATGNAGTQTWEGDFPWVTGPNPNNSAPGTGFDIAVSHLRILKGKPTNAEAIAISNTPVTVAGLPFGPPPITALNPGLTSMEITWAEVDEAVGYRLYIDGVEDTSAGLISTPYVKTGLTQGQVYEFAVKAEKADTTRSALGASDTERACMIVTSTQVVNTRADDPAGTVIENALSYLPGGSPGPAYLGWRWNKRAVGNEFYWWTPGTPPRSPVYPYLGPWTDGMTIEFVSGATCRVIEWNRGQECWRETDLTTPGQTVTINHSNLTMNAGGGPVGATKLNCTLLEHATGGMAGWTLRVWNYNPAPIKVDLLTVDDSVPGQLTATWASDWNDVQVRIDGGAWIDKGAATTHVFTSVSAAAHTVEARLDTPIGTGDPVAVQVAGSAYSATVALSGSGTLTTSVTPGVARAVALSGSGSLSAGTPLPGVAAQAALAGSGALAVGGTPAVARAVALTGSGQLTATGTSGGSAAATLSGSGALTVGGAPAVARAVALTGSGALTFATTPAVARQVALTGSGSLATSIVAGVAAGATLTGSGTLTAATRPGWAVSATLSGSGQLTTSVTAGASRSVAFTGSGLLSLSTGTSGSSGCALTGSGTLTIPTRTPAMPGAVTLTGSGTLTTARTPAVAVGVQLAGTGALTTAPAGVGASRAVPLTGSGSLTVGYAAAVAAAVLLAGSGSLNVSGGSGGSATATLSGSGALTVGGTPSWQRPVPLSGSGSLVVAAAMLAAAAVTLTGDGSLDAGGHSPTIIGGVDLDGSGDLSCGANTVAVSGGVALSGGGVLTVVGAYIPPGRPLSDYGSTLRPFVMTSREVPTLLRSSQRSLVVNSVPR